MVGRMRQLAFENKPFVHNIFNDIELPGVMEEEIAFFKIFQY
jgi:hypothetical protein